MSYKGEYQAFLQLSATEVQALVDELLQRPLTADTMDGWLRDWAHMGVLFQESLARLDIAVDVNTADTEAPQRVAEFRQTIWPIGHKMQNALLERLHTHETLVPSALSPLLASMKRRAALNQTEEAVVLVNEESELMNEYAALVGAQTIEWQGESLTARQAYRFRSDPDPAVRAEVWQKLMIRRAQDREAIHTLWQKLLTIRQKIAQANGFATYLDCGWQERGRDDYTPEQCEALHRTIQAVWSPLHARLMQHKQQELGMDYVPVWEAEISIAGQALKPFATGDELVAKTSRLFHRMDAEFGALFDHLVAIGLLDIAVRSNTAAVGGFARAVGKTGVFVMLNLIGQHFDVVNLTHEMGHAFALIESTKLPYHLQWGFPEDFTETPSSVMEILAIPYWDEFYQADDLQQAKRYYFQSMLRRNLHEATLEAFQLWAYRHPEEAQNMALCDAKWLDLQQQFLPGINYALEQDHIAMGWQSLYSLIYLPFLSMEYVYGRLAGLALLRRSEHDKAASLAQYKRAIGLGSSVSTTEIFAAIGLEFFPTVEEIETAATQLEAYIFD